MRAPEHSWLPRTSCSVGCVGVGDAGQLRGPRVVPRVALRVMLALLLAPGVPLLVMPLPGRTRAQRIYCRLVLRCFGVRIAISGSPIRNLRGVLVVSSHMSWLDVFAIGSVLPGSFVARADMFTGGVVGMVARILRIIPIERASLRRLPAVVDTVARRLRAGQTVVAFPEGTTWCGLAHDDAGLGRPRGRGSAGGAAAGASPGQHLGPGPFYPAMFQAAIDAGRPVQPLRLTYHHVDGSVSTAPAYVGDDTLWRSIRRLLRVRRTIARVHVESLQLPGTDRRTLAGRCQTAVQAGSPADRTPHRGHGYPVAV
ncbi:lysophospholipid acyltransferase family protein [Mycobacterium basiliense]|nr:lysophospholipid acyltransferase family protein [Mycobacterium basiliense]